MSVFRVPSLLLWQVAMDHSMIPHFHFCQDQSQLQLSWTLSLIVHNIGCAIDNKHLCNQLCGLPSRQFGCATENLGCKTDSLVGQLSVTQIQCDSARQHPRRGYQMRQEIWKKYYYYILPIVTGLIWYIAHTDYTVIYPVLWNIIL